MERDLKMRTNVFDTVSGYKFNIIDYVPKYKVTKYSFVKIHNMGIFMYDELKSSNFPYYDMRFGKHYQFAWNEI